MVSIGEKYMMRTLLAFLFVFLSIPAFAQQEQSALVGRIQNQYKLPGLAALVFKDGKTAGQGISGVKEFGKGGSLDFANRFHLAGCAKPMTALLCAYLVEQGQFNWNSTVAELYPKLPESINEGWKKVTLRQLLTNQAGLPEDSETNSTGMQERLRALNTKPSDAREYLMTSRMASAPSYPPEHRPSRATADTPSPPTWWKSPSASATKN